MYFPSDCVEGVCKTRSRGEETLDDHQRPRRSLVKERSIRHFQIDPPDKREHTAGTLEEQAEESTERARKRKCRVRADCVICRRSVGSSRFRCFPALDFLIISARPTNTQTRAGKAGAARLFWRIFREESPISSTY